MGIRHARINKLATPGDVFWAELTAVAGGRVAVGVATAGVPLYKDFADNTAIGAIPAVSGEYQAGVSQVVEDGDILSVGLDLSLGKVHFYLNADFLETQVVPASSSFYLVSGVSKGAVISANLFQHTPFQFATQPGYTDWVGGTLGVPALIDNQFLSVTV